MVRNLCFSIVALLLLPTAAYAEYFDEIPLIGVIQDIEIGTGQAASVAKIHFLTSTSTRNVLPKVNTTSASFDINALEQRAKTYIENNFQLDYTVPTSDEVPPTVLLDAHWLLNANVEPGSILMIGGDVQLASFSNQGNIKHFIVDDDKTIHYRKSTLYTDMGAMIHCEDDEYFCDTSVNFLVNGSRFTLNPGESSPVSHSEIASVTLVDAKRQQEPVLYPEEEILYIISFDQTLSPIKTSGPFNDVPFTHIYSEAIRFVKDKVIVEGYSDGTYKPERTINRAEFVKMIIESQPKNEFHDACFSYPGDLFLFSDVQYSEWYGPYVCIAKFSGLIDGYNDGTFKPAKTISYSEAAKIVSHAFSLKFAEKLNHQEWYEPYIEALANRNATPRSITQMDQQVTRGELAFILYALLR